MTAKFELRQGLQFTPVYRTETEQIVSCLLFRRSERFGRQLVCVEAAKEGYTLIKVWPYAT